jgi:energy-coupling factor transport system permease protein
MSLTTFQTVERNSIFTRLDFRPKLVMMAVISIIAYLWESPVLGLVLMLAITAACVFAGVKLSYLRTIFVVMIPFFIILLLTMGFFNVEQVKALTGRELTPVFSIPRDWWLVGGATMTAEGLLYGCNIMFKSLTMVLVIPLGIFTTDVNNMIVGMVRARIPYKIAFIFSSTLRFLPLLLGEIQSIIEAQRLRGLAMEKMGAVKRIRVYSKVAVPLILSAMVKSQQLEVVLQSKAFSGSPVRTFLHESILRPADYAIIGLFVLLFVAALVAYFAFGFGTFAGPFYPL